MPKILLTVEETAVRLGVGHSSIYNLLNTKQLNAIKVGGVWRIPEAEVERYLIEGTPLKPKKRRLNAKPQ